MSCSTPSGAFVAWIPSPGCRTTQIAKFMGPAWGPPGSCRPQMGPMLAPRTLLSGYTAPLTLSACLIDHLMLALITPQRTSQGWLKKHYIQDVSECKLTHLTLDKMAAIFADAIFRCIFVNKKFCILIWILLKFIHKDPIVNNPALV